MSEELKPCPFCGSIPFSTNALESQGEITWREGLGSPGEYNLYVAAIGCRKCGFRITSSYDLFDGDAYPTLEQAMAIIGKQWNTRIPEPDAAMARILVSIDQDTYWKFDTVTELAEAFASSERELAIAKAAIAAMKEGK